MKLEIDYPIISGIEIKAFSETILPEYINYIFNFALVIGGLIVFGMLTWAGFKYLTSAGNPSIQKKAREKILASFLGLIILLSSYLILATIDPQLVVFRVPGIAKVATSTTPVAPPDTMVWKFDEIPTGFFIDQTMNMARINNINELSRQAKEKSDALSALSQGLSDLVRDPVNGCKCSRLQTQNCPTSKCVPCAGSNCAGDPCLPNRALIDAKRLEIENFLNDPLYTQLQLDLVQAKTELENELERLKKGDTSLAFCSAFSIVSFANLMNLKQIPDITVEVKKWEDLDVPKDQINFYCSSN